ncbi:MAG: PAS domain-containing protein, partial [Chloroflexota bacterium]
MAVAERSSGRKRLAETERTIPAPARRWGLGDTIGESLRGQTIPARVGRRMVPALFVLPILLIVHIVTSVPMTPLAALSHALLLVVGTTLIAVVLGRAILWLGSSERARNEAERSLERFFDLSIDLFVEASFDGHFRRVNDAWERTFGYSKEELTSRPFLDFIHPDDRELTAAVYESRVRGDAFREHENRYRARDGTYRWLQWKGVTLEDQCV